MKKSKIKLSSVFTILVLLTLFISILQCKKEKVSDEKEPIRISYASCVIDGQFVEIIDSLPGGIHENDILGLWFPQYAKGFLGIKLFLHNAGIGEGSQEIFIPIQPLELGVQDFDSNQNVFGFLNNEPPPCHEHAYGIIGQPKNTPFQIEVTHLDTIKKYIEGTFYVTVTGCDTHTFEDGIFKVYYEEKK